MYKSKDKNKHKCKPKHRHKYKPFTEVFKLVVFILDCLYLCDKNQYIFKISMGSALGKCIYFLLWWLWGLNLSGNRFGGNPVCHDA